MKRQPKEQFICPTKDQCPWSHSTIAEKEKHPDLYCPHERPHVHTKDCDNNKCCANCVSVDQGIKS